MAARRTPPTDARVAALLSAVPDAARRADAERLCALMTEWTGEAAALSGASIVGFGEYEYRYESGHEGTAPLVGFSPRKANLVVYLVAGVQQRHGDLLERLGPHRAGKGCLYLKRLDDIDLDTLRALVDHSVRAHRAADRRTQPDE